MQEELWSNTVTSK